MPYPEEYGGLNQPYETYLQALEEVAAAWMSVGVGVSVHVMASYALSAFGTAAQREKFLPDMLGGRWLGAYALSEAQAGSDISAMTTRAKRSDEGYELERCQGLDHSRLAGRLLHHLRADRRRAPATGSAASTSRAKRPD